MESMQFKTYNRGVMEKGFGMTTVASGSREARYHGLRMTAEEYLRLKDDGCRYELIDGVICVSPSPTLVHQEIITQLAIEIGLHLRTSPGGKVAVEIDVHLGKGSTGRDLVYRPDVVFLSKHRAAECHERIVGPPDVIVEVISPDSRQHDTVKKKSDYERCGVPEYWLIDPEHDTMTFYRLAGGRYVQIEPVEGSYNSMAIPGFALDLVRIRSFFKPAT